MPIKIFKKSTQQKTIRMPELLIDEINKISKIEETSFSIIVIWLLKQGIINYKKS